MRINRRRFVVSENSKGQRLDKFLVLSLADSSRSFIQKLIEKEKVIVNGNPVSSCSLQLKTDDEVKVDLGFPEKEKVPLSSVDIPIIYQDQHIIVIDKPAGLIVHPAGENKDSVVGSLIHRGIELSAASDDRPGVVHRLDKDTSGLMVLAKTEKAHQSLYEQFKNRKVIKEYTAVVKGILSSKEGKIDVSLKRRKYKPTMKVSFLDAKKALTYYKVLEEKKDYSLVRVYLKTGRMHQIRVHFSYIGHPVMGDKKYDKKARKEERLYLHSTKLGFFHPVSEEYLEFESSAFFDFKSL